jgi:AraC family transcriptional regulator
MLKRHIPLTLGSSRSRTLDVGPFNATEVWFPAGLVLPPHLHERVSFAIILEGGFDVLFGRKSYPCPPATVFTEPLGEKHSNRLGPGGAHVLVLQPDHGQVDLFQPCRSIFDQVSHFQHQGIAGISWRLAHELRAPDTASALALQGLGFEMLAMAARVNTPPPSLPPAWLVRAADLIHSLFLEELSVEAIAREVGVHPVHLARVFRKHYRQSIGAFVRRLRLDWAAAQLATTDDGIACIAASAGFSDQSHFTRAFKRYVGIAPGRYRRTIKA